MLCYRLCVSRLMELMAYDREGNLWTGGYNNPLHRLSADHKSSEAFSLVIQDRILSKTIRIATDRLIVYRTMWCMIFCKIGTTEYRWQLRQILIDLIFVGIESPEYQKQRIERTLDKFSESTDQRDDITFLILKIREKTELPKED